MSKAKTETEPEFEPYYYSGLNFLMGNHAVAEGAIMAGCRYFAGYPITPSTPIAERMSWRLAEVGGRYMQMEDELGSIAAIIGASVGGVKSMTATSGPGVSLMLENLGLAYMMEVPIVIVNIMRGGPSTGMPTLASQGDIMQARWGSHGDYRIIAYAPSTVQEMFDFTIKTFNAAEKYRVPAMLFGDQLLGLMSGNVNIPPPDEIEVVNRKIAEDGLDDYVPYAEGELIPPMAITGQGYHVHMTGLTHDERGYPSTNVEGQRKLIPRLIKKIESNADKIIEYEEWLLDDADIAVVCYGTNSRSVISAIKKAREKGIKVGMFRLKTIWPFPEKQIRALSEKVKTIIVAEVNMGQLVHPVREYAREKCTIKLLPHPGGTIHTPYEVFDSIKEATK